MSIIEAFCEATCVESMLGRCPMSKLKDKDICRYSGKLCYPIDHPKQMRHADVYKWFLMKH